MKILLSYFIFSFVLFSCKGGGSSDSGSSTATANISSGTTNAAFVTTPNITTPNITAPPLTTTPPSVTSSLVSNFTVIEENFGATGSCIANGDMLILFSNEQVVFYDTKNKVKKAIPLDLVKSLNLKGNPAIGGYAPSIENSLLFKTPTRTYIAFTAYYYKVNKYVEELFLGTLDINNGFTFVATSPDFRLQLPLSYQIGTSLNEMLFLPVMTSPSNLSFPLNQTPILMYDPLSSSGLTLRTIPGNTLNMFLVTTDKTIFSLEYPQGPGDTPLSIASTVNINGSKKTVTLPFKFTPDTLHISVNNDIYFLVGPKLIKSDINMNEKASVSFAQSFYDELSSSAYGNYYLYSESYLFVITKSNIQYTELNNLQLKSIPLYSFGTYSSNPSYSIRTPLAAIGNCFYAITNGGSLVQICTP